MGQISVRDGRIAQFIAPDDGTVGFSEGLVTNYLYDERGLPEAVVDPLAGVWHFEYDAAGRPVRESAPSGIDREVSYTAEGYIDTVVLTGATGSIETIAYSAYDLLGNPGTITTSEGTTTVDYDALYRVDSVIYPDATTETFDYDKVGNRTLHVNRAAESRSYQIDAGDQLTAIVDPDTQATLESFSYDVAGRRKLHTVAATGATTSYSYNGYGRLMSMSQSGGFAMNLSYDATGSLYRRSDPSGTAYYYGSGLENRYGEKVRLIRGGAGGAVLGEAHGTTPTLHAFLRDGSANLAHVTQISGSTHTRRYGAFGEIRAEAGTAAVERGFAGQIAESTSGLIRMGFRHYDVATGRFLQSDPLGLAADQLYAYAANNPYRYSDPLGLSPEMNVGGGNNYSDHDRAFVGFPQYADASGGETCFDFGCIGGRTPVSLPEKSAQLLADDRFPAAFYRASTEARNFVYRRAVDPSNLIAGIMPKKLYRTGAIIRENWFGNLTTPTSDVGDFVYNGYQRESSLFSTNFGNTEPIDNATAVVIVWPRGNPDFPDGPNFEEIKSTFILLPQATPVFVEYGESIFLIEGDFGPQQVEVYK